MSVGLVGPVSAQHDRGAAALGHVQIAYVAPAACPTRDAFEARLGARLHGATPARSGAQAPRAVTLTERAAVVLTVALRARPPAQAGTPAHATGATFLGSISLADAHGVLGPRDIEAASCSEAVDALTFVAALLLDDRARATAESRPETRPPAPASSERRRPTRGAQAPSTSAAQAASTNAASAPGAENAGAGQAHETSGAPASAGTARLPAAERAPAPAVARVRAPAPPRAAALAEAPREIRERSAASPMRLRGTLQVAGLAASGVAPALRPGLGLSAGIAAALGRSFALSVALGLRATLAHEQRSAQGNASFAWWSSTLALCGVLASAGDALRGALCLDGEAGQILAKGRATEAAQRVHAAWLALGPAARLDLRLRGPWRLVPAVGLLLPAARDRFVVGASELHRVSRLTFRTELALAVEWP